MPALTRSRRAFTLIEALIAVVLGAMLVGVAFAGLRTASGAVTAGNRIALENAMLREGFASALEELDFWRGLDDPASGRTALRQRVDGPPAPHPLADGLGLPFTPMKSVFRGSDVLPGTWDPQARHWSTNPGNPDARWGGNFAECLDTDCRFGRYAIFFDLFDALRIPAYQRDNVTLPAYGDVAPTMTWWSRQFRGVASALGYYGLVDYMPANTINAHYGRFWQPGAAENFDGTMAVSAGGVCMEWLIDGWKGWGWADSDRNPMTRYRATLGDAWGVYPARPDRDLAWLQAKHRSQTPILYHGAQNDVDSIRRFIDEVGLVSQAVPVRPTGWPSVKVSVLRYFSIGRFFNQCLIRMTDPKTGATVQLSFNGLGTTLRGARQQRGLDDP